MELLPQPRVRMLAPALVGVLGAIAAGMAGSLLNGWFELLVEEPWFREVAIAEDLQPRFLAWLLALALFGFYAVIAALRSLFVSSRSSHRAVHRGAIAIYVTVALACYGTWSWFSLLQNPEQPDPMAVFEQAIGPILWFLEAGLLLTLAHIHWWRRAVLEAYGQDRFRDGEVAPGDQILESIRTGGEDPDYRRAWVGSIVLHLLVILGPMLGFGGCDVFYNPIGSGTPAAPTAVVKVQEVEKEEYIVADNSPIIFERPDITDSEVIEQMMEVTENTYEVTGVGQPGALGEGGGKEGGWPDGMEGPLRFIYVKHSGRGWDDGMKGGDVHGNAAANFLAKLAKIVPESFEIVTKAEYKTINQVARGFKKGFAPHYVFFTGEDRFSLSSGDLNLLSDAVLENRTMIFADAGGPGFHRSWMHVMRRIAKDGGTDVKIISDDDPIFRMPFKFPNGIEPLWAHGGTQALGIKHKGRWVVFYHPGDCNDAWKDQADKLPRHERDNAFQIGYNIIWYAITNYLRETREQRKQ